MSRGHCKGFANLLPESSISLPSRGSPCALELEQLQGCDRLPAALSCMTKCPSERLPGLAAALPAWKSEKCPQRAAGARRGPLSLQGHHLAHLLVETHTSLAQPCSLALLRRTQAPTHEAVSRPGIFSFYQIQEIRFALCSDHSKIILGTVDFQPL